MGKITRLLLKEEDHGVLCALVRMIRVLVDVSCSAALCQDQDTAELPERHA